MYRILLSCFIENGMMISLIYTLSFFLIMNTLHTTHIMFHLEFLNINYSYEKNSTVVLVSFLLWNPIVVIDTKIKKEIA